MSGGLVLIAWIAAMAWKSRWKKDGMLTPVLLLGAFACLAAFMIVTGYTALTCQTRNWCSGSDGDAWMPSFFLVFTLVPACAYLITRTVAKREKGRASWRDARAV